MSQDALRASHQAQITKLVNRAHVCPCLMHYLPAVASLLGPCRACRKVDSLQSIPCSLMQAATLSHPRYYPPPAVPAPALNIPHNKAKRSDKSYYFQPFHLEAKVRQTFPGMFLGEGRQFPKEITWSLIHA